MPLFLWLPYIIFSGMFATPKSDPAPARVSARD